MAKFYDRLTPDLQAFIERQHLFFTATAPPEGRINLSPKGMDTFRCLDDRTVGYLDLTGSGNETAAHLQADASCQRMTIMFCSFDAEPLILRLYGQGRVVRPRDRAWAQWYPHFASTPGERQIVILSVESVQTSCGFGVPCYGYQGDRPTLRHWAQRKGAAGLHDYWVNKNQTSIDGLPTHLLEHPAPEAHP